MKATFKILSTALVLLSACGGNPNSGSNSQSAEDRFVDSVVNSLTLKQKIGQLNQVTAGQVEEMEALAASGMMGSILNEANPQNLNRIQKAAVDNPPHIPVLISRDVIHGYKTIFPIPLGQAASFDTALVCQGSEISAVEASSDGIRWTFSPMLDIARDPRWGRIAEGYGEDPYLTSVMGAAAVRGYQGNGNLSKPTSMAACAKHFVGYGAAVGGRDYNSTYIPMRQLRNVYLPPFRAAANEGVATYMSSFNDNDGVPSTGNKLILSDILRGEWKFDGFVVSDWFSIGEMVNHGFADDMKHAAERAINAGLDMDMVANAYKDNLEALISEGKVSEKTVDNACRNIVRIKYRLGLFTNPYISTSQDVKYAPAHLAAAQKSAEESAVLLKNNGVLPFKNFKKILLTGPLSDAPHDQLGTWVFDGEKSHTVTPLVALKDAGYEVNYVPVLTYSRDKNLSNLSKAIAAAKTADVIVFVGGEESILSGEAHCLANLNLQGAQSQLLEALKKTGKPVVSVIMAGRPLTIADDLNNSDAMIYMFHPGTMGGPALVNLLSGNVTPSGKLPVTFPKSVGQVPIYYGQNMTGRPASGHEVLLDDIPAEAGQTSLGCTSYMLDAGFGPLLEFGFGLSYTSFEFSDFNINRTSFCGENDEIKVTFLIKNCGNYDGAEIPQLYVRDLSASITRPIKELKAFTRVFLKKGESKKVELSMPLSSLKFFGLDDKEVLEKGKFTLWIANSSNVDKAAWKCDFEVK
ncbi:MAG: glycoside hydrolase family 3 C-terminal domain-containing protein [Bacteroidales bacterium]|nr:glycoside hydrolase family 3 C-terminal domain-containing protein [Bacteroidales bacterium]